MTTPPSKIAKNDWIAQQICKNVKKHEKSKKKWKNCKFLKFFTPRGKKRRFSRFFAIFCHFLAKFENAVTFEQIITERCLTPEMKDLVEYFKLKKKAGSYIFSVFHNLASKLPKNLKIRKYRKNRKNRLARVNISIFWKKILFFAFFSKIINFNIFLVV